MAVLRRHGAIAVRLGRSGPARSSGLGRAWLACVGGLAVIFWPLGLLLGLLLGLGRLDRSAGGGLAMRYCARALSLSSEGKARQRC